jgi:RNA polymerase sigma-70 factor (ECF subfamily)
LTPQEFTAHYRQHLPAVMRFLARRVEPLWVEDLCSEVFLIAYQKRHQAPTDYELAWLYSIGGHLIANHRRRQHTATKLIAALSMPRFAPSAESLAVRDETLAKAWAGLNPNEQEVLALVALDELSVTEAAKVLGITANATSVRLNRARTKLAALMKEHQ